MYRPKCLLLMSLSYKVFELLKKHAAANSKKGVVGNNGTKIPMTPNVNDNKPNIVNNIFIFFIQSSKFKVQSSEFCVQSSEFCVQSSAFKVLRSKFGVQSSEFRVQGSKFKVQSSEFKVQSQILFSFHFANFIYMMQMNASMLPYNISAVQTH